MSVDCFVRVQDDSCNRGLAYCLLLMLADIAHDTGEGRCPNISYLSRAIRTPESRIPRLIAILERSGELVWNDPPGYFFIDVGEPSHPASYKNSQKPTNAHPGHIYLVQSPHGYKIGRSKQLPERMKAFGLQLPFRVELLHSIPTSDMIWAELHLHALFAPQRINGEWFNLTADHIAWICGLQGIEPE